MNLPVSQYLTLLALGCAGINSARADTMLAMAVDTPEVSIKTRSAGRSSLRLPSLQYSFSFDANCVNDQEPVSLQLSVADTRKTLRGDDIGTNSRTTISLNIPARQIAPVVVQGFCEKSDAQEKENPGVDKVRKLTISAALSAQASLRCASESDAQTLYVSKPLDVTLTCESQPVATQSR